jgi:hypothetical protein
VNRLDRFLALAGAWPGPISAAMQVPSFRIVYLVPADSNAFWHHSFFVYPWDIRTFQDFINNPNVTRTCERVAFTLLKPDYSDLSGALSYPINRLRNIAINVTTTNYVFVIDVDFLPTPHLYQYARDTVIPKILNTFGDAEQRTAIVVPCFGLRQNTDATSYSSDMVIPDTLSQLRTLFSGGMAYVTDEQSGHGPTMYKQFLGHDAFIDQPFYEVCYESQWEPYYIIRRPNLELQSPEALRGENRAPLDWTTSLARSRTWKQGSPWYDERFTNQGGDKQQHALLLNALGYRFLVLRSHFLIHLDHGDKLPWPGGGLRSGPDFKRFSIFDNYMPELELRFGSRMTVKWPKGCKHPLNVAHQGSVAPHVTGGF